MTKFVGCQKEHFRDLQMNSKQFSVTSMIMTRVPEKTRSEFIENPECCNFLKLVKLIEIRRAN